MVARSVGPEGVGVYEERWQRGIAATKDENTTTNGHERMGGTGRAVSPFAAGPQTI